jgi:hypothetical protein
MDLDKHLSDHLTAQAFTDLGKLRGSSFRARFTRQPYFHTEAWILTTGGGIHSRLK